MREGWDILPLGDLCKTGAGGTPLKSFKEYYEGGDIPWLMSGEVGQGEITETTNYITRSGLENSSARLFPPNTLLVAMYGATAGQVGILRFEASTNQAVCGILPSDKFLPEFLYYFFLFKKDELVAQAAGNAQPNISQIKIKNTGVPTAPLPEQRRIVAILDEAFEGIATAKANAEKNLQNAREVFEGHLNAVFSQRGEGWVDRRLGDVAMEFGRGKSKHRPRNDPKLYGGNFPFIQTGDVRNSSHLITSYDQTYNDAGLAQSKLWPKGTLCITIAANIAETGILDFDACFPDSIIGLVANEKISTNKYIEYLLTSFKSRLQLLGKGSAQDNINLATFENQYFPFPPLSDQKLIISTLDDLHEETQHLESLYQQKLTAIDELKQSLLHQAFNGDL